MAVKISHASIDERGKATGGAAGDQTGKEVCIANWFTASWDVVLRPKTTSIADKSAKFMEQACSNQNIGYNQGQRNTLYEQAKKVNFDVSKITVKCECDCSSLIHVAVIAAGVNVVYGSNGFTTRTMVDKLVASGNYEKLTDSKYLTSDKYLKRGDILVNIGSHTVMVLENGSSVATVSPTTPNVATSTSNTSKIVVGDVVSIAKNATYYNSTKTPSSWILNKTWIVKSIKDNRVVIDKSADGKNSINSPIDAKYLTVVKKTTTATSSTTKPTTTNSVTNEYYPKYIGTATGLDAILEAIGVPAKYRGSYTKRKPLAEANGIKGYTGNENQNSTLKSLAKSGKLKKIK